MFVAIDKFKHNPVRLRSSVNRPSPFKTDQLGGEKAIFLPSNSISPVFGGCTPKIDSTTSVRPAPASPARPTTSPARASKLTPSNFGGRERLLTRSFTSPIL